MKNKQRPDAKQAMAELLLKRRTEKGLFRKQAAREIGVSHDQYAVWERAGSFPSWDNLNRIALWTGCSVDELVKLRS